MNFFIEPLLYKIIITQIIQKRVSNLRKKKALLRELEIEREIERDYTLLFCC